MSASAVTVSILPPEALSLPASETVVAAEAEREAPPELVTTEAESQEGGHAEGPEIIAVYPQGQDANVGVTERLGLRRRGVPNPAKTEARAIIAMVRRGDMSEDEARALISVPAQVEAALRAFAVRHPGEGARMLLAVEFRGRVLAEFDRQIKAL